MKKLVVFLLKYVLGISLIAWMVLTGKLDFSGVGVVSAAMLAQLAAEATLPLVMVMCLRR